MSCHQGFRCRGCRLQSTDLLLFAITLRFNAALLGVAHLPLIIAVARTVVDFVIMSCLAAMIFVVLAAAVQSIENAVRRLIRSAHPGQEVSA